MGRTGVFIAMDDLLNKADAEGEVDVYKCVLKLRKARPNMVQTKVRMSHHSSELTLMTQHLFMCSGHMYIS